MHPWNQPILDAFRKRLERLPHALLVHGPRGVGKLALAERLAQLMLCESADVGCRPCDSCDACRWFVAENHPDYRRVEPEILWKEPPANKDKPSRVVKIEQVREDLEAFVNLKSHRAGLRVVVLHPADEMQSVAISALLKNLEEPPPGAVFILVAHRPALLPATIRSRCIAVPVPVPPRDAALRWLAGEGAKGAERWLAYAGGAPLRALQYAGQAESLERLLASPAPTDDREDLERLAEALQKIALDKALLAFGLPSRFQTGAKAPAGEAARAWLTYARRMGHDRLLTQHPLNARLFSSEMLAARPKS
ncbi:MAG TPA: DNA polymerase III subunit delta' [Burkholderiales bacterium]